MLAAFAAISVATFAQNKTVVGKWKLSTLTAQGVTFNIEDPQQIKGELKKQFEASGAQADSAMVEMVFKSIYDALANMVFDFGTNGKLTMNVSQDGQEKKEEEDYTVDYAKGVIVSKGREKEQNIAFKFDNDNLILTVEDQPGKTSVMTFKKLK